MITMNREMEPDLEYVLLPTSRQWSFLSSSRVREIRRDLAATSTSSCTPAVAEYYRDGGR